MADGPIAHNATQCNSGIVRRKPAWFKFYPSDWLAGTAALSPAERGTYVTLIALMYDYDGPVLRDDHRLMRRCGFTHIAHFRRALGGLIREGKIVQAGQFLTNPRVEAEIADRQILSSRRTESGSLGGQKKQQNQRAFLATGVANKETRVQSKKEPPLKSPQGDDRFARFWAVWPHKVQRPYAEKCFAKVAGEVDAIVGGVTRYVRDKPPDRPWLNPSTFLNQRRWEDAPAQLAHPGGNDGRPQRHNLAAYAARLAEQFEAEARGQRGDRPDGGAVVRLLPGVRG